ncbi:hypothetical protein STRIP9103_03931 [Streptomyces ipomoeae 91-03]|uniref:Uncharacterized protein n=1 Tax=Streptomyces ipomoeae 91-03 TaxID=698759 RepID=L1L7R9_9ACTN|nr:hypothetical protein STRIP9103_03931 [Streptomyces ipomoeae 91-03]
MRALGVVSADPLDDGAFDLVRISPRAVVDTPPDNEPTMLGDLGAVTLIMSGHGVTGACGHSCRDCGVSPRLSSWAALRRTPRRGGHLADRSNAKASVARCGTTEDLRAMARPD